MASEIKKLQGQMLDKVLAIPDSFEKGWKRKAVYIIFDLGLILVGVLMIGGAGLLTHGNFSSFTNMSPGLLSVMPKIMGMAAAGAGLAWLLEDSVGKKWKKEIETVMAVLAPIFMVVGIGLITTAGGFSHTGAGSLHYSFSHNMTKGTFCLGLFALPVFFTALSYSVERLSKEEKEYVKAPVRPLPRVRRHSGVARAPHDLIHRRRFSGDAVDLHNRL